MAARCGPLLAALTGPRGQRADLSGRADGVLGVLFAGKWCGPCEEFVGVLKRCYSQVRERGEKFEVVFVSADKEKEDFERLSEAMPWWRIDFDDYLTLNKMRCLFKIQDIPCLALVDLASGQTIISNACDLVREHPDGRGFPWKPRSYEQLMEEGLLDKDDQVCHYHQIQNGFKGLYFAANWCPPCKAFAPELREVAERIRDRGVQFEIILVSSDRTAESFEVHRSAAPWLAVPYADEGRRRELAERFGVQGIPTLLILDEQDRVVCRNARTHVGDDPLAQEFPWRPALVEELSEKHRHLLDEPLLVLFVDAEPEEVRFALDVLTPAAEAAQKYGTDQADLIRFFIGTESEVAEQVRETAGVDDSVPQLVIVDLTLGHRFVLDEGVALTAARVTDFVERWRRRQLQPAPFDAP